MYTCVHAYLCLKKREAREGGENRDKAIRLTVLCRKPCADIYLSGYFRSLVTEYTRQVFILLFQRLQSSKTTKYVKSKYWNNKNLVL